MTSFILLLVLGKAFEKKIKAIKNQYEKQIKTTDEHGKQLVKFIGKMILQQFSKRNKFLINLIIKRAMKYII